MPCTHCEFEPDRKVCERLLMTKGNLEDHLKTPDGLPTMCQCLSTNQSKDCIFVLQNRWQQGNVKILPGNHLFVLPWRQSFPALKTCQALHNTNCILFFFQSCLDDLTSFNPSCMKIIAVVLIPVHLVLQPITASSCLRPHQPPEKPPIWRWNESHHSRLC